MGSATTAATVYDITKTAAGSGYGQSGGATALYLNVLAVVIGGATFMPISSSFGPVAAEEPVMEEPTETDGYY